MSARRPPSPAPDRLDLALRALADPTRRRLLHLLARGPLCVGDLATALGLAQPAASRHLAYLRRSLLVEDEKRGLWSFYRLAAGPRSLALLLQALEDDAAGQPGLIADQAALDRLRKRGGCCPQHQPQRRARPPLRSSR